MAEKTSQGTRQKGGVSWPAEGEVSGAACLEPGVAEKCFRVKCQVGAAGSPGEIGRGPGLNDLLRIASLGLVIKMF